MKRTRIMYQASIKFKYSEGISPWMYCESANTFYKTYEECLESVKKEIKRRKYDQPIVSYMIEKITREEIEIVEI